MIAVPHGWNGCITLGTATGSLCRVTAVRMAIGVPFYPRWPQYRAWPAVAGVWHPLALAAVRGPVAQPERMP